MTPQALKWIMNLWPPYLGAGIRVLRIAPDWRSADVCLKMHWYNRNYVNTHFGGSLFAMADPFYMLLLMHILGREYRVLDKAAAIEFAAPARGTVMARFCVDDALVNRIREKTAGGEKHFEDLEVSVKDGQGRIVARIVKTLYFRKK
jgi:acyl-coenzyme A thioesterase PaaI-like protein